MPWGPLLLTRTLNDSLLYYVRFLQDAGGLLYERAAGPQLMGSVLSLLLLSDQPELQEMALGIGFYATRMALAATQTTGYSQCISDDTDQESLSYWLEKIPTESGKWLALDISVRADMAPSADGIHTLCATIASAGGKDVVFSDWKEDLLLQGAINVANAIAYAAQVKSSELSPSTRTELCEFATGVFTFVTPATGTVDVLAGSTPAGATDYTCMLASAILCRQLPWGFRREPIVAPTHDFAEPSPVWQTCFSPFPGKQPHNVLHELHATCFACQAWLQPVCYPLCCLLGSNTRQWCIATESV